MGGCMLMCVRVRVKQNKNTRGYEFQRLTGEKERVWRGEGGNDANIMYLCIKSVHPRAKSSN